MGSRCDGPMRIAAVQFEHKPDDKRYNLSRVAHFASAAASAGASLVACPEMCLLGYWHLRNHSASHWPSLAEPLDGPLVSSLVSLATRHGTGVGAGFLEEADGQLFNSYALCMPSGDVHVHRKLHAFEHPAISSGSGYTVFDTPWGVRMAIL